MPKSLVRGTMAYFTAAFLSFVAAQILMVSGLAYPQAGLSAAIIIAAVHPITIGWLTLLMFGALRQFVPVIAATQPAGDSIAVAALAALLAGLASMLVGFLGLGGMWGLSAMPWLPAGGALVGAGMVTVAATLAGTLWKARLLPLPARFVAGFGWRKERRTMTRISAAEHRPCFFAGEPAAARRIWRWRGPRRTLTAGSPRRASARWHLAGAPGDIGV